MSSTTHTDVPDGAPLSSGLRLVAGIVVLVAAAAVTAVMAVPGETGMPGHGGSLYDVSRWALLALLAGCALVLLRGGTPALVGSAATAGAISAGQLCATGIWAVKHWRPFSGMTGIGWANLDVLRPLAAVLAVAAAAAAVACLAVMRRSGVWHTPAELLHRRAPMIAGGLVAVALPPVLAGGLSPVTMVGTQVLLFSLPWGLALAAAGLLRRGAAVTAAGTVAYSALTTIGSGVGHGIDWRLAAVPLALVAVLAAGVVGLLLLRTEPAVTQAG